MIFVLRSVEYALMLPCYPAQRHRNPLSEALVYHDDKALYFEVRGKDSGVVRFSYEMLETLKEVVEEQTGSSE